MDELERYKKRLERAQQKVKILEDLVETSTRKLYLSNVNLEEKNHALEQLLEKNKELELFVFVASHDLQEPLRTIRNFVGLFQKQYHGQIDPKADKYLHFISKASDRLSNLVKGLLDYGRIGTKKEPKEIDCNLLIKSLLEDFSAVIEEKKCTFTIGELPTIYAHEIEVRMLFQNLISNGIKFAKKDSNPEINISARKTLHDWEFAFKDNGIGIAEEHLEKIFTIFQRVYNSSEFEGTGIGLAHCKKVAELHGGKIWVTSKLGEGSTFYVTLKNQN